MSEQQHETSIAAEGTTVDATAPDAVEQARRLHHLATADPERDGLMTGPAHEEKYGLERAEASAAAWRGQGVHPTENRALQPGEDGAENLRGAVVDPSGDTADTAPQKRTASQQGRETR